MLISELMSCIAKHAPLALAEDWDNVGLLLGDRSRAVTKVLVSLDVTPNTVKKALDIGADLILSHHPLIFRPLKQITDPLLLTLLEHKIAVISLHTNLDIAPGGVNHALAEALELEITDHLSSQTGSKWHHVVVSVPPEYAQAVADAAFAAGAGRVGNYASCSTRHAIEGTFVPLQGAKPFTPDARQGSLSEVQEIQLEFMADDFSLPSVLAAVRSCHPYETPLLYHWSVANSNPAYGLGLVGKFAQALSLHDIVKTVSERLLCPHPLLWTAGKDMQHKPERIAICGGAGASILKKAEGCADIVISGDIGYHHLLDSRIPIIDAGHFFTEYPVLEKLNGFLSDLGLDSSVLPRDEHEYIICRKDM